MGTRLALVAPLVLATLALALGSSTSSRTEAPPASASGRTHGPLRVHPSNPRYFADTRGRPVYLTGSHTWTSLQDRGAPAPQPFDYDAYLRFLEEHGHNFIRLWAWEQAQWAPWTSAPVRFAPLAFARPGPGTARDGQPRFDVTRFEPAYFARLRRRVMAARDRGLYVAVMLFQGWSIDTKGKAGNPWPGHPFHPDNNVNGLNGDVDGDGEGREVHTLVSPAVTEAQKAYVRKVVDTLHDLDNVLWEISNESHPDSTAWQYEMIRFLRRYEAELGVAHPVGMTAQYPDGANPPLFESPADWVSPVHTEEEPYRSDPPPATGAKIVVSDTDHLWGVGGDGAWVWKTFTRGLHPIYMDPMDQDPRERAPSADARRAMGHTRRWAERIDLAAMTPRPDLAGSRFCLAAPGAEYLVYVPTTRSVIVNLSDVAGSVEIEWFNPRTGETVSGGQARGGATRFFTAPFTGDKVLYLRARPTG